MPKRFSRDQREDQNKAVHTAMSAYAAKFPLQWAGERAVIAKHFGLNAAQIHPSSFVGGYSACLLERVNLMPVPIDDYIGGKDRTDTANKYKAMKEFMNGRDQQIASPAPTPLLEDRPEDTDDSRFHAACAAATRAFVRVYDAD